MKEQIKHYLDKLTYEMDSADVANLFKDGNFEKPIIVIDTRSPSAYHQEHIPGSISFPHRTMNEESTASLDRSAIYITYCDGIGCNASTKGAYKLSTLGFQVKELIGGMDWWKRDGYSTEGKAGVQRDIDVVCAC
jgi:rhodanese-related sulfurtransferase